MLFANFVLCHPQTKVLRLVSSMSQWKNNTQLPMEGKLEKHIQQ